MSCAPPKIVVGGVILSTNEFENAKELLTVSGDEGDPTLDAYDENIAGGNNTTGTAGIQIPPPQQTTLPGIIGAKPKESNTTTPNGGNGTNVTCGLWLNDYNYQLSPNFKVRDFSINALWPNQVTNFTQGIYSITADERVCNLENLAVNVAELMLARFGPFNINSGIRNVNSTSGALSQHVKGQAMDIQFPNWSYARYWDNAQWIKNNIPYDQFIFEHSTKPGQAWYHLSFNKAGNRVATSPTKFMTMYKNRYGPGLLRFG
jgi:hypothetical protein